MQPEDSLRAVTVRAGALWDELGAVYDAIDARLAHASLDDLGPQVARMHALQAELAPLTAIIATARDAGDGDAEVAAAWRAIDARIEALLGRCATLTARAAEVRDAVGRELSALQAGRAGADRYRGPDALVAHFTSQRV